VIGLMALTNLIAIGLLSGLAFRLLKDYTAQRRAGQEPSSPGTCYRMSLASNVGRTN
jgi:hypothetical protein